MRITKTGHAPYWLLAVYLCGISSCLGPEKSRTIRPERREVAITFDDLPAVSTSAELQVWRDITTSLVSSLTGRAVPAIGFVNEGKLYKKGEIDPRKAELLSRWLEANLELGNHTYSHRSLFETPLAVFEADVIRGEQITRPLLESRGQTLRFFRHPFLNTGPDLETKSAFEAFLSDHGYTVAPVTIDNSEWIFARAYDHVLDRGDAATQRRITESYLKYMEAMFRYYEDQSESLFGYEIRQILLLHANRLNADTLDRLLDLLEKRGYIFVPLERAMTDEIYARPDRYAGSGGITWIHRWAITENRDRSIYQGEPAVPEFVMKEAGVDHP